MFEQNGRLAAIRDGRARVRAVVGEENLKVPRRARSGVVGSGRAVHDDAREQTGLR